MNYFFVLVLHSTFKNINWKCLLNCISNLEVFTLPSSEVSQLNSTHYLKRQCQLNYYYCSKQWLLIIMYKPWFAQIKCSCANERKDCCHLTVQDWVLMVSILSGQIGYSPFFVFCNFGKELIGCVLLCSSLKKIHDHNFLLTKCSQIMLFT